MRMRTSAWRKCWVRERTRSRWPTRTRTCRRSKARRSESTQYSVVRIQLEPDRLVPGKETYRAFDMRPARVVRRGSSFVVSSFRFRVSGGLKQVHRLKSLETRNVKLETFMGTTTVNISAAQVKDLRDKTGAPMMDCKQALTEAKGDMEQAVVILRKKGVSVAAKKATRVTSEGSVSSYIHAGGKIGVLVEVNCESDFVARTEDFKELVHDIAMHIAASDPKYVRKEDVTAADFAREKEIFLAQAVASGKPQHIAEKMVAGKMEKFYEEVCLLEQPFIKDQTISIGQLIASKIGKLGENIAVRRFARFKVGDA
ncbi:MAG TPA: translation elongation factor Ts, partial [Candidatus Sulfotelmatobacter sp.]|nr:translation elongation factor Ts [Candidatus Sulfotelmatobacter sp.]